METQHMRAQKFRCTCAREGVSVGGRLATNGPSACTIYLEVYMAIYTYIRLHMYRCSMDTYIYYTYYISGAR